MKRFASFFAFLGCFFIFIASLSAADIRHTYSNNPLSSFYIDDRGGSINNGGSNLTYYINFEDVDQSSRGTLLLYGKNPTLPPQVDNGYLDDDFTSPSGIDIYPLSNLLGASFDGEIGLANNSPFTPVNFLGSKTGLKVEQISYTSHDPGNNFVILEYRVVNLGSQTVHAMLGISNDFDIDLKNIDANAGFSNTGGIPIVYQQDLPPNSPQFTTVGMALIAGNLIQHRIESCSGSFPYCSIFASDNDLTRIAFFEGNLNQVGDLTQGGHNLDFAVTIAADLGNISTNRGASAVFCYSLGNGSNGTDALSTTQTSASDCQDFYQNQLQICQNNIINFAEECDDGNISNTDNCTSLCKLPVCGDTFIQASNNEQCDNGNLNSNTIPNACRSNCKLAYCGEGVTDSGEQCDDGNTINNDSCTNTCQLAKCGDAFVQRSRGEFCDDGNNVNGDGCSADCLSFESCGNGTLDPGEACEDGNSNTSDNCPSGMQGTCQGAFCGDGFLQVGIEECDDGNNVNGDACSADCHLENLPAIIPPVSVCGNGIVEADEECDDGNDIENDACANNCHPLSLQGGTSVNPSDSGTGSGGCALALSMGLSAPFVFSMLNMPILILFVLKKRRSKR